MYFNFNVTVLVLVESIKNQNLLIVFVTAHYCPQSASPQLPQVIILVLTLGDMREQLSLVC